MTDLKSMLEAHPDCMANRNRFKSFLQDVYPTEKRMVNLVVILVECGIVEKINKLSVLDDKEINAFIQQMENEYGVSTKYSYEAIVQWATALDKKITVKKASVDNNIGTHIENRTYLQGPTEYTEGDSANYVVTTRNGKHYISQFVGFEEDSITIPSIVDGKKIYGIDSAVFKDCPTMKHVVISYGIERIGESAFENCRSLLTVKIPESVSVIDAQAFNACWKLESLNIPSIVSYIGNSAFRYTNISSIVFPDRMEQIEACVCFGCEKLTSIVFPSGLKEIKDAAFSRCKGLSEVRIPYGTEKIQPLAFWDCNNLRKIYIPVTTELVERQKMGKPEHPFRAWMSYHENVNLTIACDKGSKAMAFARKHGLKCEKA